jgi:phosphoserine aminotransferase
MTRAFNFSAGPAALPDAVLERIRSELPDSGSGMSVMEISHRSRQFIEIAEEAESSLRKLLGIPDSYRVLFMQGGATAQFAAVPLNLARPDESADYLVWGHWSRLALGEGGRFTSASVAVDAGPSPCSAIPDPSTWALDADAAYVYYAANETIEGLELARVPATGKVPLATDMSSTILSRPIDVSEHGVIFAGAQKNMGPAGLTIVIVREDLIGRSGRQMPAVLDYGRMAESRSMLNTPPTFAWYVAGLVFSWLLDMGGLAEAEARNRAKKDLLYEAIDGSTLYSNRVDPQYRSWTNVVFTLEDESLDERFLAEAKEAGLVNLKGHRTVGGMRASIYNAMPIEGVEALVGFMDEFERNA